MIRCATMPTRDKLSVQYLLNDHGDGSFEKASPSDRGRPNCIYDRRKAAPSTIPSSTKGADVNQRGAETELEECNWPSSSNLKASIGGPTNSTSSSQRVRSFQCQFCERSFHERGNLNKHISSVHFKEKPMVCPELGCKKSFSFRDGLMRHIAHVHRNERMHSCDVCHKSFKQASHLSKHKSTVHKTNE